MTGVPLDSHLFGEFFWVATEQLGYHEPMFAVQDQFSALPSLPR